MRSTETNAYDMSRFWRIFTLETNGQVTGSVLARYNKNRGVRISPIDISFNQLDGDGFFAYGRFFTDTSDFTVSVRGDEVHTDCNAEIAIELDDPTMKDDFELAMRKVATAMLEAVEEDE